MARASTGLRVIAGRLRGRRLAPPRWEGLRPTSDRLRETLFNVLGEACAGARVLDLCAGTGAVGIEAISRGAAHVAFVDADPRACALIASNLAGCGVAEGYTIVRASIERIRTQMDDGWDVVFLDPPYASDVLAEQVETAASLVAAGGVLVVEHGRRRDLAPLAGPLVRSRVLPSGDSALTFYRWPAVASEPGSGPDGETA